ncbi:hypothetical protein HK105_204667 [Polyrhizophydium stewartii]|uniref:NADH dehydrogenase [ubiquinone] iron-sulfur protein 5 n=1 Tax=Polyrhizophydium stewartii TaxID=2732419 RepID=A0ABR4N8C8_9FUNG|nr:hypothetical protein HK105_003302 [Polyrhizophydium stewartii]
MSSGFGTNGGRGRCYPFWQEFMRCHVQADSAKECVLLFEDYQECLYHRKELKRLSKVREEYLKQREAKKSAEAAAKLAAKAAA